MTVLSTCVDASSRIILKHMYFTAVSHHYITDRHDAINRCGEVEGRSQEYFGLYMNLPEESQDSIQDAITAYMGADERELKCAKCSHNQSSVVTSITRPPR